MDLNELREQAEQEAAKNKGKAIEALKQDAEQRGEGKLTELEKKGADLLDGKKENE